MKYFSFRQISFLTFLVTGFLSFSASVHADEVDQAIKTLQSVTAKGEGNAQAIKALKTFQDADGKVND